MSEHLKLGTTLLAFIIPITAACATVLTLG